MLELAKSSPVATGSRWDACNLLPNGELLKPDMEKSSRPTLQQKEGRGIAGSKESK